MHDVLSRSLQTPFHKSARSTLRQIMTPVLRIENLTVDFVTEGQVNPAVKGVSLTINKGEILGLVGESGSGKSVTSLSILRLLPSPPARYTGGSIYFSEEGRESIDLLKLSTKE